MMHYAQKLRCSRCGKGLWKKHARMINGKVLYRPSDHLLGNRLYVHGPIQPMQPPSWWERWFGRG